MENDRSELRWGVEQNLDFIEIRLFCEGSVNRSDVTEQFGLSVNQASSDLNRHISFAYENMTYDKSARIYVGGPGFKLVFGKLGANRYLAKLQSLKEGGLDRDDCWITDLLDYGSMPAPARSVHPEALRAVVGAIRRTEAIEVNYQSLFNPEPRWRWIEPQAVAFDGFRWHAAYES